jgi:predicted flap endonuclease-1-like 5' DNA nuclease
MNPIFLWWLTLGALIGFVAEWLWDWFWFRARRQAVSTDVETQVSTLRGERDRLSTELKVCGERRLALEGDLTTARGRLAELEGYRVRVGELEPLAARVDELSAENTSLRAELDAARLPGVDLSSGAGESLAAREVGGDEMGTVASLREYNMAMYDELEASRRALSRFAAGRGDPLIDIDGIGPVYQQKLYDAGVVSFDQVAAMHPERLRSVVAPNAVFNLDTTPWIEEARRFGGRPVRDPLIDINGIGPVYEQKLLNAGVTSFEQLAAMSVDEIRAVIAPEAWQSIDPEAWVAEARMLAKQVRDGSYRKGRY